MLPTSEIEESSLATAKHEKCGSHPFRSGRCDCLCWPPHLSLKVLMQSHGIDGASNDRHRLGLEHPVIAHCRRRVHAKCPPGPSLQECERRLGVGAPSEAKQAGS